MPRWAQANERVGVPTPTQLAYIAGIFDGEGTTPYKNKREQLTIEIKMTDQAVIKWIAKRFKVGNLYLVPKGKAHWKDQLRWRVRGEPAKIVYKLIKPYLRIK